MSADQQQGSVVNTEEALIVAISFAEPRPVLRFLE